MRRLATRLAKNLFPEAVLRFRAYQALIANRNSYLHHKGWMTSLRDRMPVDAARTPIPWMNYSILSFLDERLRRDQILFEFGSGFSTIYFAQRVKEVVSIEYKEDWYRILKEKVPSNVELVLQTEDVDGDFCRTVARGGRRYDVVIVDARDRVNCVKQSLGHLTDRGVVILDDSHREAYREGIEFAKARGFRALAFEGMKPCGDGGPSSDPVDRSTVLYRDGNCLGI